MNLTDQVIDLHDAKNPRYTRYTSTERRSLENCIIKHIKCFKAIDPNLKGKKSFNLN